jgi:hypothetical protein
LPTLIIGPLTRKRPQPHEVTLLGPPGDLFTAHEPIFKVYASTAQRRSISSAAIVGE